MICAGCRRTILVPRPAASPSLDRPRRTRLPHNEGPSRTAIFVAVGGAGALVAVIAALVFVLTREDQTPASSDPPAQVETPPADTNRLASRLAPLMHADKRSETEPSKPPEKQDTPSLEAASADTTETADKSDESPSPIPAPTGDAYPLRVADHEPVTFGAAGCPIVVIGSKVWDYQKKTVRSTLDGKYDDSSLTALSPDGRYFAATEQSAHHRNNPVLVWDTSTGQLCTRIPGDTAAGVGLLHLAGGRAFIAPAHSNRLYVWDLAEARELKSLTLAESRLTPGNTAIAHNGLYVATIEDRKLVVIKIETGETIVKMRAPKKREKPRGPELPPGMVRVDHGGWIVDNVGEAADDSECSSIYSSLKALDFSPDSRELVAVSTYPQPRVICWNHKGRRVLDETLHSDRDLHETRSIHWFGEKDAWLLGTDLFDRKASKVVLSVRRSFLHTPTIHVQDDNHLVGTFSSKPNEIQTVAIPWDAIRASLEDLEKKAPALLSPAEPVSIVFELGSLRGDQNKTVRELGDALKARLEKDGLEVESGKSTFFRIRFSEKAGDSVPVYERQSPFHWDDRDTGQRVHEAEGKLVVELVVPGRDQPVWRDTLAAGSDSSYDGNVTELVVRDSMVENLANRMDDLNFPYFIPKSDDLLALPVVLQ